MDPDATPVEQPAEPEQQPVVGTIGLKLTLRGGELAVKPTLDELAESIRSWDLSQYGLSVSVTDIEWR
jgi:hypothetical protein